jgi:hypothetical protein
VNQIVCNYAPIRFQPYREIGEFVNVGMVVNCPQTGYFDFQLDSTRHKRIIDFFPELDREILKTALEHIKNELERFKAPNDSLGKADSEQAVQIFRHLIRPQEGLVWFGEPGMLLTDNPKEALENLFARFVQRQFAHTKEYQETVMRRRLLSFLKEWNLDHFYKKGEAGVDIRVPLPFIHFENDKPKKAIKPLDLARTDSSEIYKHGGAWLEWMRRLKRHKQLPDQVIFTVKYPDDGKTLNAAEEICKDLKELVFVVPFEDTNQIRALAEVK